MFDDMHVRWSCCRGGALSRPDHLPLPASIHPPTPFVALQIAPTTQLLPMGTGVSFCNHAGSKLLETPVPPVAPLHLLITVLLSSSTGRPNHRRMRKSTKYITRGIQEKTSTPQRTFSRTKTLHAAVAEVIQGVDRLVGAYDDLGGSNIFLA